MPSLDSRVASDAPTLSPAVISLTSLTISTVPLLILVGMLRACRQTWGRQMLNSHEDVLVFRDRPDRSITWKKEV